jgi:hypothetical protein
VAIGRRPRRGDVRDAAVPNRDAFHRGERKRLITLPPTERRPEKKRAPPDRQKARRDDRSHL